MGGTKLRTSKEKNDKNLAKTSDILIFEPGKEKEAYPFINSLLLKTPSSYGVVLGEWEETFQDPVFLNLCQRITEARKEERVICLIKEVREAIDIGHDPKFIFENLETYFPGHAYEAITNIKKLLNKGYLTLYIAPGYPLWHFGFMNGKGVLIQEIHPVGGKKKHAFIRDSSLIASYDSIFKSWCKDSIPLPPKMVPTQEIVRPTKHEDIVEEFHPGILEFYNEWFFNPKEPLKKIIGSPMIPEWDKRRLKGYESYNQRIEKRFSVYASILNEFFREKGPTEEEFIKYEYLRYLKICMNYNHPSDLEQLVNGFKKRVESIYTGQTQRGEHTSFKKLMDNIKQKFLEPPSLFKSMDDVDKFLERIDQKDIQTEVIAIRKAKEQGRDKPTKEDKEYARRIVRGPF